MDQTGAGQGNLITLLLFFQNKEIRLKMTMMMTTVMMILHEELCEKKFQSQFEDLE
jgi:hypothetical protein